MQRENIVFDRTQLLIRLARAFPKTTIGEETIKIYLEMLADVPTELLEFAINRLIQTAKFFPAIAEIREAAREYKNALNPNCKPWAEVEKEIRAALKHNGQFTPPTWSCKIVKELMDSRWQSFLGMRSSDEGTMFAQARRAYEDITKRDLTRIHNMETFNSVSNLSQKKLAELTEKTVKRLEKKEKSK